MGLRRVPTTRGPHVRGERGRRDRRGAGVEACADDTRATRGPCAGHARAMRSGRTGSQRSQRSWVESGASHGGCFTPWGSHDGQRHASTTLARPGPSTRAFPTPLRPLRSLRHRLPERVARERSARRRHPTQPQLLCVLCDLCGPVLPNETARELPANGPRVVRERPACVRPRLIQNFFSALSAPLRHRVCERPARCPRTAREANASSRGSRGLRPSSCRRRRRRSRCGPALLSSPGA